MRISRTFGLAAAAAIGVAACGGGAVLAVLGSLGAGGGNWYVDAEPNTPGFQPLKTCGGGGGDVCIININPEELYRTDYSLMVGGNHPDCTGSPPGNVTGAVNVSVPGCFVGQLLSVNEALSTNGLIRAYFDYVPVMSTGVWVDIQDDTHRFVFTSNGAGCEIVGGAKRMLTMTIVTSNYGEFAEGNTTTLRPTTFVQTLNITGSPPRTFSGEFVGASGLRLSRAGETIELLRRDLTGDCN